LRARAFSGGRRLLAKQALEHVVVLGAEPLGIGVGHAQRLARP